MKFHGFLKPVKFHNGNLHCKKIGPGLGAAGYNTQDSEFILRDWNSYAITVLYRCILRRARDSREVRFCSREVRSASYCMPPICAMMGAASVRLAAFARSTLHGTVWLLEIPGCTGLSRRPHHAAEEGRQWKCGRIGSLPDAVSFFIHRKLITAPPRCFG